MPLAAGGPWCGRVREGLEALPAEVDWIAAKVQVGGGKGTPISFAVAKGNQVAPSTFDV